MLERDRKQIRSLQIPSEMIGVAQFSVEVRVVGKEKKIPTAPILVLESREEKQKPAS